MPIKPLSERWDVHSCRSHLQLWMSDTIYWRQSWNYDQPMHFQPMSEWWYMHLPRFHPASTVIVTMVTLEIAVTRMSPCLSNPCKNGATCKMFTHGNRYWCDCKITYRGDHCEVHGACASNPCQNGGICRKYRNGYWCNCSRFYGDNHCKRRGFGR